MTITNDQKKKRNNKYKSTNKIIVCEKVSIDKQNWQKDFRKKKRKKKDLLVQKRWKYVIDIENDENKLQKLKEKLTKLINK